jgi:hypothetical protein
MHWYGTEASYNMMVLDRLSLMLEKAISKSYDDNLVFYLANQMGFFFSILLCSQMFNLYPSGHSSNSFHVLSCCMNEVSSTAMLNCQAL